MSLFRKEVLEQQRVDWLGSVDLATSSMRWPLILVSVAFIAIATAFLLIGTHQRSERAQGQLIPSQGLLVLTSPTAGSLNRIFVKEGDSVTEGQPLFDVSTRLEIPGPSAKKLGEAVRSELDKQQRLLENDLIYINASEISRGPRLEEEIGFLRQQLRLLDEQQAIKARQAAEAEKMLARVRALDSGMLTALQIQQYESAVLNAQVDLKQLEQRRGEARRALSLAERQRGALSIEINERRNAVQRSLADVAQSIARNATETDRIVRAPRAGVVTVISGAAGQPIEEGSKVVTLMPHGSVLQAELWASSRAVGLLQPGGRVVLRYQAFPYRRYGLRFGRIARISGSALKPADVKAMSGLDVDGAAFRVVVDLEEQDIRHGAVRLQLRPNMMLDADLLLDRAPLYRLLLPETIAVSPSVASPAGPAS